MMGKFEGDGCARAGVIGVIWQGRAGLEADQHDHDRVNSDQGFLIGNRGAIGSDQDN